MYSQNTMPSRCTVKIGSIQTLSSIPWCWIRHYTLLFTRCFWNASQSCGSRRNKDRSQRSVHNYRVGRCRWCCASTGKPCNIVACVVQSGAVKSGGFVVDACAIPNVRMRPASERIVGMIYELWHIRHGPRMVQTMKFKQKNPLGMLLLLLFLLLVLVVVVVVVVVQVEVIIV